VNIALAWSWVSQSLNYLKKRPFELSLLFLAYALFCILLNIVPLINRISTVFQPLLMVAFYYACIQLNKDEKVTPGNLFLGFRSSMRIDLFKLGAINTLWAFLITYASMLVDDGFLWNFINSKQAIGDMKSLPMKELMPGVGFVMFFYLGFTSITCFAIPLIEFKKTPVFKAIFFSAYGFFKNINSMLAYGLILFGISLLASILLSILPILMAPLMVFLSILVFFSQYPMYKSLFGD
jgi:hypothetical protein